MKTESVLRNESVTLQSVHKNMLSLEFKKQFIINERIL